MGLPAEDIRHHRRIERPINVFATAREYDPTRTTTLRNQFAREMTKRFTKLRGVIRRAIVDEDCFALVRGSGGFAVMADMVTPGRLAFDFPRSGDKVEGFMKWLRKQQDAGILEVMDMPQLGEAVEHAWTNKYIQSAYQKGIQRARQELKGAGYGVPSIPESGGIHAAFNTPFHLDRVGLLYTRVFNDLKGITNAMDHQISRVLAQGMADGKGPRDLARLLTKTISGPVGDLGITDTLGRFIPAQRRAIILARTEIIRAHHLATIQEYRNWAVEGVTVQAEFATAGDSRVCPKCAALHGRIFDLGEEPLSKSKKKVPTKGTEPGLPTRRTKRRPRKESIPQWTPVTMEDLKGIDSLGLGKEDVRKYPLGHIGIANLEWDRDKQALYHVNKIGEHMNEVFSNRPGLAEFVRRKAAKRDVWSSIKLVIPNSLRDRYREWYGEWRNTYREIHLAGKFRKKSSLSVTGKASSVGKGVLDTFRHEYGHALHGLYLEQNQRTEWFKLWKSSGGNDYFKSRVSKYAGTNVLEAFAESFCAWTHPNYGKTKGKTLPKEIEQFFNSLFGERTAITPAAKPKKKVSSVPKKKPKKKPPARPSKPTKKIRRWEPVDERTLREHSTSPLEDFGIVRMEWDKDKQAAGWVNVIGEQMTEVFHRRPGLARFVEENVKPNAWKIELHIRNAKSLGAVGKNRILAGQYSKKYRRIRLAGKGPKKSTLSVTGKRFSVGKGVVDTFRHEYGHALHFNYMEQRDADRWHNLWKSSGGNDFFKSKVGKYAGTNRDEAFAECFCAWTHPDYGKTKGKTLPKEIERFFNDLFREG